MDALLDEVESLEAILMDDVNIKRNLQTNIPEMIETTIFPVVGGDTDRQYICVTLQVYPKSGYPDVSPEFNLLKPRGLDDCRLEQIKNACIMKLEESVGYPVVFDLIEVIREQLTGSNLPSGQCVVCLYGFQESDEFTKTECYHYLHSYCLARHLIASKKNYQEEQDKLPAWLRKISDPFQAVCPICREPIKDDADHLKHAPPPLELENAPDFQLTKNLKELQARMTNLFLHQKSRGAIIDLEAEDSNVISIEPDDQANNDRRKTIDNSEASAQENGIDHSSNVQNSTANFRQNQTRSNQNRSGSKFNNQTSSIPSTVNSGQHKCIPSTPEPANNTSSYSQSQNRRHHHRSRRHNNHHHHHHSHYQSASHSQQDSTKQQKAANVQGPCNSSNR